MDLVGPTNRREFLKSAGGVALGVMVGTGLSGGLLSCAKAGTAVQTPAKTTTSVLSYPWQYQKLDPVAAAERAYTAYYAGGCMYGAFEGIVGELRARVGSPYDAFPTAMMKYGGAGVSGWGTLCGSLNGAAAAIFLVTDAKLGNPLVNEVFGWYGVTPLPDYTPANPKIANIETSIADSQLCHVSVTTWCNKTGFKTTSPERADRCAWLTASVVRHTVNLLNSMADGTFKATFAPPASVTGCLSCHGKGGAVENVHITNQTDCTVCHTDLATKHPVPLK